MRQDIRVYARGGLGNQLFQFSAAYSLSKKLNLPITVDDLLLISGSKLKNVAKRDLELDSFENSCKFNYQNIGAKNTAKQKFLTIQRLLGDRFPKFILKLGAYANESNDSFTLFDEITTPVTINSYCGNRVYFEDFSSEIVTQITNIKNPSGTYQRLSEEIRQQSPIAIHLRLGDYKNLIDVYGKPDINYYKNGIDLLKLKLGERPIWVFSDEPAKAEEFFSNEIQVDKFVEVNQEVRPIEYLNAMAQCLGIVCANSSFSWWAGYIASERSAAQVIFPRPMFNLEAIKEPFNWLPPNWTSLGRSIEI